jgi:hypothetical protein
MGVLQTVLMWMYWATMVGIVIYLVHGVLTVGHRHHHRH